MTGPSLQEQIEAAEAYEALLVPGLTGEWASRVADAAAIQPGDRVLDVACGTGALTRAVALRTGAGGRVVGVDAGAGMLEVARRLAPNADFRQATAETLPFADGSFDALVSQFGLMFFGDRPRALREALRVLVPGGRLAIAVWDRLESMPAYGEEVALVERIAGAHAAHPLRSPFALGDREALQRLFDESGVARVQATTSGGTARFASLRIMIEADLRGWLPVMGVVLPEPQIAQILREAERALARYVGADGTVAFGTSVHIVTGTRP
jgi:ubiquinone/menaquinone biosynthesis C-methylase UbiE